MSNENKVTFLRPDTKLIVNDKTTVTACGNCGNKTFLFIHDPEYYPIVKCCACGTIMGRMGWIPQENEQL